MDVIAVEYGPQGQIETVDGQTLQEQCRLDDDPEQSIEHYQKVFRLTED